MQGAEVISDPVEVKIDFKTLSFVGISCYHLEGDYKDIKYRLLNGDRWSEWIEFRPQHENGPRIRIAYEGELHTSDFSALQFKASKDVEAKLIVRLFLGGKELTNRGAVINRSSSCTQPDFCDRSCWCPDCPVDTSPQLTDPTHIIVHHSAGSNADDLNFSEVVNFIWDLHVNTNGWDDIGYNWLIDRNGVLYEGRPDDYQGAHFSCINENTVGICLLGNFSSTLPTEDAIGTLIDLIAYEATVHDIDVLSESYHLTGDFNLVNVAGHRDSAGSSNSCSGTACPGNAFYPMLDSIRAQVADLECYENNMSNIHSSEKPSWAIYPNPFYSHLMVSNKLIESEQIIIKDIQGKIYARLNANVSKDLSHLPSGLYLAVYKGLIIEKIIKQ